MSADRFFVVHGEYVPDVWGVLLLEDSALLQPTPCVLVAMLAGSLFFTLCLCVKVSPDRRCG